MYVLDEMKDTFLKPGKKRNRSSEEEKEISCVAFVFSTYMSLTCFFEVKKMMLMLRYISKFYFSRDLYTRPGVTDCLPGFVYLASLYFTSSFPTTHC